MARKRQGRTKTIKRGRGRPVTTGTGILIGVRCLDDFLRRIDAWRAKQDGDVSRPDAIRSLAELGLAETTASGRRSQRATLRARDLAGEQIDKLIDPSVTDEERQKRKQRLLKGPGEFRNLRSDLSKPKG
jgi:hypothetical protein